jgi:hypothetical protein
VSFRQQNLQFYLMLTSSVVCVRETYTHTHTHTFTYFMCVCARACVRARVFFPLVLTLPQLNIKFPQVFKFVTAVSIL